MDRRNFLQITAASVLAAQGHLPLLAAEGKGKKRGKPVKAGGYTESSNIYTDPAAIEPITGYLPNFKPVGTGAMSDAFTAKYSLVACHGSAARSNNEVKGSIKVDFSNGICKTTEIRSGWPPNVVEAELKLSGKLNVTSSWMLRSYVKGIAGTDFTEKGTWDGKSIIVKSNSWTQKHATGNPLIARWALPGLLCSGQIKSRPLTFDMLDDSTLRPDQSISYTGEIVIPVAGGNAKLDCYTQTGWGIVPTHYLVDADGRVQLITMDRVNWALSELK
jgi:hypothetical protein